MNMHDQKTRRALLKVLRAVAELQVEVVALSPIVVKSGDKAMHDKFFDTSKLVIEHINAALVELEAPEPGDG